jgi:hypothetical protein
MESVADFADKDCVLLELIHQAFSVATKSSGIVMNLHKLSQSCVPADFALTDFGQLASLSS